MNCKHLKIKINKKFECKKTNKIIDIKKCNKQDCKNFEYKEKEYKNNPKLSDSSTGKHNSNISAENNTELYRNVQRKSNSHKMKKKSSKLAKLERNRYSVFTEDLNICFYANKNCFGSITKHEVFSGRNRQRSMKYGFIIPLCEYHHYTLQENKDFNQYWHDRCRDYWLNHYGNLDEFIKTFGKSYLK